MILIIYLIVAWIVSIIYILYKLREFDNYASWLNTNRKEIYERVGNLENEKNNLRNSISCLKTEIEGLKNPIMEMSNRIDLQNSLINQYQLAYSKEILKTEKALKTHFEGIISAIDSMQNNVNSNFNNKKGL